MLYTLITGACGGLGSAFAEVLAERKEPLYLTGRSEERLSALAERLREKHAGLEVQWGACDLKSSSSREAFFAQTDRDGVRFCRLVCVAGVDTQMGFTEYDEGRIVTQVRVNFEGAVSMMRGVLSRCPLDGRSELLAIGSVTSETPMPYFALYSATKRALEQFCIALRTELKGKAKVTCVLPGSIPTREDVKENIRAHGIWGKIGVKSPRTVAEASLKAVRRNKRRKIVGGWNKFVAFFSALVPLPLRLRFVAKRWKRTKKDFYA